MHIPAWGRKRPLQALAAAIIVGGAVTAAVLLLGGAGQAADECEVVARVWGGGGTVAGDATVVCGETVTLTATAEEGYCFSHWGGGAPSEGCPLTDELEVETSEGLVYYSVFFKAASATATPTATPKVETALPYDLLTTKQVTYPGSYSFLEDVNNVLSDAYGYPPLRGHPDDGPFGLLVHATDADGTLHKDFYNGIAAGDRFDVWADDHCFIRYIVTEVRPNLASVHTVKVFEVEHLASVLSDCERHDHIKADATIPVTFRWHVAPGVEGEDGIRVMLGGEPTPGPGRYRIVEGDDMVITIPAGMTLVYSGTPLAHGDDYQPGVRLLDDVESGSQLALGGWHGTEVGRFIETPSPSKGGGASELQSESDTRDVGALFDELVKSIEMVP